MDKYTVLIAPGAQKEVLNLPKVAQQRIDKAIRGLSSNPRPQGCKKLVGTDAWRVRVGEYRIVYSVEDNILTVEVVKVSHRKDVYR